MVGGWILYCVNMEEYHKNPLIINRMEILREFIFDPSFLDRFIPSGLLQEDEVTEILTKPNRSERVTEFLRIMTRRGPDGMRLLIKELMVNGLEKLAWQIEPDMTENYRSKLHENDSESIHSKNFRIVTENCLEARFLEYTLEPFLKSGNYSIGLRSVRVDGLKKTDRIAHISIPFLTSVPATYLVALKTILIEEEPTLIREYSTVEYFKVKKAKGKWNSTIQVLNVYGEKLRVRVTAVLDVIHTRELEYAKKCNY